MSATDRIRETIENGWLSESEPKDVRKVRMTASDAEALCDLADAARLRLHRGICDWCYEDDCTGHTGADARGCVCPCNHACHDAEREADEAVEAALDRLDREDGP